MKLKKFAALALAGVMAVSMLAGCAGKGTEEPTEEPSTSIGAQLAAALSEKDQYSKTNKITVSEDAALLKTLEGATKLTGITCDESTVAGYMATADTTLKYAPLPAVYTDKDAGLKNTSEVQKALGVAKVVDNGNYTDKYIVNQLVNAIIDDKVALDAGGSPIDLSYTLPTKSGEFTTVSGGTAGDSYQYNFTYTLSVAVTEVENSLTGETTYVAAYALVRTPAKAAYEA